MNRSARWSLALAAAALGTAASAHDALDVRLSVAQPQIHGDADVKVDVTVTNPHNHAVDIARWQLPQGSLQGVLFRITRDDGSVVPYTGPLIKRAEPTAADMVRLEAGESRTFQAELSRSYELGNGHLSIQYVARGRHADSPVLASSVPTHLWLDGRSAPATTQGQYDDWLAARRTAATISYTGNCSSSQKTTLSSAVSAATNYATASNNYLAQSPHSTSRYVKWFGTYTSSGWNTAHTHYTNEVTAFTTKPLTLDCSCTDSGTYAYVYPNAPYKIYVCGAFWSAPMTGTDSKGGTLVHEMSHFYVVASTDDWAYGQTAAANLAKSNPTKALDNADSHEYFAENNPFLN